MIERDGAVIRKHCSASPDEVQAAIKAHQEREREAEALTLGMGLQSDMQREARANHRRLLLRGEWDARHHEREARALIKSVIADPEASAAAKQAAGLSDVSQ